MSSEEVKVRIRMTDAALSDPKLKLSLEYSTLLKSWVTFNTRTGANSWTSNGVSQTLVPGHAVFTLTSGHWFPHADRIFFRLRAEELP